jgi:hypothetical protein
VAEKLTSTSFFLQEAIANRQHSDNTSVFFIIFSDNYSEDSGLARVDMRLTGFISGKKANVPGLKSFYKGRMDIVSFCFWGAWEVR